MIPLRAHKARTGRRRSWRGDRAVRPTCRTPCGSRPRTNAGRARREGFARTPSASRPHPVEIVTIARCGSASGDSAAEGRQRGQARNSPSRPGCRFANRTPATDQPAARRRPSAQESSSGRRSTRPSSARIISPPSRRTPSPGTTAATFTPHASTAPASSAASARAKETRPIPPTTYPHAPGWPSRVPELCIRWTAAVPGSRGPAFVPMIPWPCSAVRRRSSETCRSTTDGNRFLEEHLDRLGVVADELFDLGTIRGVADPRVSCAVAERSANAGEQGFICDESVYVAWGELVAPHLALRVRVVPQSDRQCRLRKGHHRCGSTIWTL